MAIKIQNIPVEALLAYQKIIEDSSLRMSDFFNTVMENQKKGIVSKSYVDRLEKKLSEKINKNNEYDEKISKELQRRVINTFGRGVTLSNYMNVLIDEFHKEEEEQKKLIGERKEIAGKLAEKHNKGEVLKLDTAISKEKIIK